MSKHNRKVQLEATTVATERVSARMRIGAITMATSAVMALSFASPISALGKATTTSTENKGSKKVVYPEHPNAPEGDYEIAPMKIAPPSYEGHVHMPMPFVNGKLAMSLDRIDRTNSEIEFSVDKSWLGNRKIKRLGVASIRWYGFAIDNSGLYEANTFDNEWTIKMFASKADYEGLSDRHESKDRYFWVRPTFDLFYEWSNDVVFVLQLDDNTYYNGRVYFKEDCLLHWIEGRNCVVDKYDRSKTMRNVSYKAVAAPKKKYTIGMIPREVDGYANTDINAVEPEKPVTPEKPVIPEKPVTPEKPITPEKPEEKNKTEDETSIKVGKSEEAKKTAGSENESEDKSDEKNKEKTEVKPKTQNVEKSSMHNNFSRKSLGVVTAQSINENPKDDTENTGADSADSTETESSDSAEEKVEKDGQSEDKEKTYQETTEVPKLGEVKKEFNILSQWWTWLIAGTIVGAILHKIFLSIRSKKHETISD